MRALDGGDRTAHEVDCVLGVRIESVVRDEFCPLLSGVVTDSTFDRVQGWIDRVTVDLCERRCVCVGERWKRKDIYM